MSENEISKRLRSVTMTMRGKSYPLSDLIPLMQQAADRIDELEKQIVRMKTDEVARKTADYHHTDKNKK